MSLQTAPAGNTRQSYALHKLALSYRSSSPHLMDLHPGESPRRFQVQSDPIYHVYLANAVTLAYSAIEELGLEIRANAVNPSKMPDGTWNPVVKADVEQRLQKSGIDLSDTHIWTLRGPKTRIEKKRPPPSAGKPSWSRGNVRDVNVRLIDALALASWLRSSTTTHRFSETARSLTVYDAHNVNRSPVISSWTSLAFGRHESKRRDDQIRYVGARQAQGELLPTQA